MPKRTETDEQEYLIATGIADILKDSIGRTYTKEIVVYDDPNSKGSEFIHRVIEDLKKTAEAYPIVEPFEIRHAIGRVLMEYMDIPYDPENLPTRQSENSVF